MSSSNASQLYPLDPTTSYSYDFLTGSSSDPVLKVFSSKLVDVVWLMSQDLAREIGENLVKAVWNRYFCWRKGYGHVEEGVI